MNKSVVVVGMGEMGSVFARGFLRKGYSVHPVIRGVAMSEMATQIPVPDLVVLAVGEMELHGQLSSVPEAWSDRLVLLQNELLPHDWQQYNLEPTVISVWFEKKKGMDSKVIIPSPVYGPHARQVADALIAIDIPARELDTEDELLHELVLKNLYILTANIAGLKVGGTVGQLWDEHNALAYDVATDVITLQEALVGHRFDHQELIDSMIKAFNGDREHMCMGRSAPARLQRALAQAKEYGLELPTLDEIAGLDAQAGSPAESMAEDRG